MTGLVLFALGVSAGAAAQLWIVWYLLGWRIVWYLLGWRQPSTWAQRESKMIDCLAQEIHDLHERLGE